MRARVYRNIDRRSQYLGLEPVDALILGGVLWLVLTFNRGQLPVNALVIAVCYVTLRVAKRGRPEGFTTDVVRYALSRRTFLCAAEPDRDGRAHPFGVGRAAGPRRRGRGHLPGESA